VKRLVLDPLTVSAVCVIDQHPSFFTMEPLFAIHVELSSEDQSKEILPTDSVSLRIIIATISSVQEKNAKNVDTGNVWRLECNLKK